MVVFKFLFLLTIWLIFSGIYDYFHIFFGVLSAAFVTYLSKNLVFQHKLPFTRRLKDYCNFAIYSFWLVYQVILSNFYLLRIVFAPKPRNLINPIIVDLDASSLVSDFSRVVLAQSITLTPGTVTITIEDKSLKVYCINKKLAPGLNAMLEKVKWVFGDANG